MFRSRHLCAIALCIAPILARSQSVEFGVLVQPVVPKAMQAVYATVTLDHCRQVGAVRHDQGVIVVEAVSAACVPMPGIYTQEVGLGKLPQGSYRLRLIDATRPERPMLGHEVSFAVAAPTPGEFSDEFKPLLDYSGWWWNVARPGEGWIVEHKMPGRLMLSWVTYDSAGRATWYVMQSSRRQYGVLSGPVYAAQRPGGNVVLTPVGSGRFEANRVDAAVFTLILDAQPDAPVSTTLRRLPF